MAVLEKDYVVVGNSAAGVTAAEYLRANDPQARIAVVSREPYAAYGRPLISYLIEGKTTEDNMSLKPEGFYEANQIDALLGEEYEAVALDARTQRVTLKNGDVLAYGKCLLATGSIPFVPPIEGLADKRNVYTFITLDDAKALEQAVFVARDRAREQKRTCRVVVVGAGLIGLKAAESLRDHVDEVLVLELAPRILPAVLDDQGAEILRQLLEQRGIVCMPGISASEMLGDDNCINEVRLTNGQMVTCDVVVAAVGVRPNMALALDAGVACEKGIVCGTDMQTSAPNLYAAGDVTQVIDTLDGSRRPLALWPNAVRQGKCAGLFMAGSTKAVPFEGNFGVNAVDFFDVSLLTAGIINPPTDGGYEIKVFCSDESYAKFVVKDDRLFGYILLNRPANAGIYTALIQQSFPLSKLSGDIFGETPLNLEFPREERWARLHTCYPSDLDGRGWKEAQR
ncbi:MAG: FAD-dependent oxidoreductase [Gordonibacter sp.]|nr:FAD-dependent oxidoreductase [Gordonibacter sp.]